MKMRKNIMKNKIYIVLTFLAIANSSVFAISLEEKVENLEKELLEIKSALKETTAQATFAETKAYQNRISWSSELRLRNDKVNYKNSGINGYTSTQPSLESGYTKDFDPATNIRLRLNMEYKTDDNTKFVGRIGITRNSETSERICTLHAPVTSAPTTNTVFEIDKAYVDKTFNNRQYPLTLTFGVLPTSGGSSTNIAENKPRQSMFSSLMFDMNTYGIIGTLNLSKTVEDAALRMIFAKAYTLHRDNFYYQCNRAIVKSADISGLFYEQTLPIGVDNTFMIGINRLGDIKATPFIGSFSMLDTDTPASMGSIINIGSHLEARNISASNITAFAGVALSLPSPSGKVSDYTTSAPTALGSKGLDYAHGSMQDKNGWAAHIGGVYEIQSYTTKIGAEYNHGSQYWYSGTQGAEDPFNKLATRGSAYEIYVIYNLTKNIFFKTGFLRIAEEYTGSGWNFGIAYDKKATTNIGYALLNAAF
jgi:Protein of unknown function (DUF3373)